MDHVLTHRAVLTATRPTSSNSVKELYGFEIPSSTDWAFQTDDPFQPHIFVDIRSTIDRKIQFMGHYASEISEFPHPRSPESLRTLAKTRVSTAGIEAAEAFEVLRILES